MRKILIGIMMIILVVFLAGCENGGGLVFDDKITYGNLSGKVLNEDGTPLVDALVIANTKSVNSDMNGFFQLKDIETGQQELSIYRYKRKILDTKIVFEYDLDKDIIVAKGENLLSDIIVYPKFIIKNISITRDDWNDVKINGQVVNQTDQTIDYLTINIKFYDSQGNRVEDDFTIMTDVAPDETVNWIIYTLYDGSYDTYEIDLEYSIY